MVIALWLIAAVIAVPFQSKLQALASDESDAFQDDNAESVQVSDEIKRRFEGGGDTTAVVLYTKDSQLTEPEILQINQDAVQLCKKSTIPDVVRVITSQALACGELPKITYQPSSPIKSNSEDQTTQLSTVWTKNDATDVVVRDVQAIRDTIRPPPGVRAYVTGEAGFAADQSKALEGIDGTLLAVTLVLILVLLLAIYRSPLVAIVPLVVVGIAYVIAAGIAYAGAKAGFYQATGQATAILIVLMFGAGTDYCLLVLSRYREELANESDDPMGTALQAHDARDRLRRRDRDRGDARARVADYNATRWMGPVLAIGTAVSVLAGITLLPAILAALPRNAFRASKTSHPVAEDRRASSGPARRAHRRRPGRADRRRARQPQTPRDARLRRAVPLDAGVGHRPASPAGEVPARPGRPGGHPDRPVRALDLAAAARLRRRLQRRSRRLLEGQQDRARPRHPQPGPVHGAGHRRDHERCGPTPNRSARPRRSAARRPRCSTRRPPCTATRG